MKKILLILLLFIPIFVNALCDNGQIVTLSKFASNITYDTSFSKSSSTYTVTFYNVVKDIYLEYDNKKYYPNSNNEVTITGLEEGITIVVGAYPNKEDCKSNLITLRVKLQYYNKFYNDYRCKDDIKEGCSTAYCTSQFLDVKPTEELFKGALSNTCGEPAIPLPEEEKEPTFLDKVIELLLDYGIKFMLIAISLTASILFFTNKYRKMKHGI